MHNSLEPPPGIQSGQDFFENSGLVLTFLTNLGNKSIMQFHINHRNENTKRDTWIIKIRVFGKLFSKQLCFIRCRRQHLKADKQRYSSFIFVWEHYKQFLKVLGAKFLRSHRLFCFICIYKVWQLQESFFDDS